jgi:hypothetical protein
MQPNLSVGMASQNTTSAEPWNRPFAAVRPADPFARGVSYFATIAGQAASCMMRSARLPTIRWWNAEYPAAPIISAPI